MFDAETLMVLVPALPLAAALVVGFLGRPLLKERSHLPVVAALVASFVFSLFLLFDVSERPEQTPGYAPVGVERVYTLWTWADIPDALDVPQVGTGAQEVPSQYAFAIDVTLRSDPLTAVMLAMVTFVSSLV